MIIMCDGIKKNKVSDISVSKTDIGSNTHITGNYGEDFAERVLSGKGMKILDRNYRAGRYEIDIIALDGDCVVFCEVKTARTGKFGPSITWVTSKKIKHITSAANEYIISHPRPGCSYRFDVVGIKISGGFLEITHIPNAFESSEEGQE